MPSKTTKKREAKTAKDLAKKALRNERQSPFIARIVNVEPLRKFTMPKYPIYDGKSDLAHMSKLVIRP